MRYFINILGFTLVMLALMSITPVLASNHKDGDSYKEPEITKPAEKPAAVEEKAEEQAAPAPAAPEAKVEPTKEACPPPPAVKTWIAKKKSYLGHMDSETMDENALNFMANVRYVAILPFIDETTPSNEGISKLDEAGGSRRIVENLAGALMKKGYLVLPPMDSEAVLADYIATQPLAKDVENSSEVANNRMYFTVLPDRALSFVTTSAPGLKGHQKVIRDEESAVFLSADDIVKLACKLNVDCIVRGFVQEYAIEKSVHADARTFIPPFIGMFNPEHRAFIEVSYYIYDGRSGQMVWNGTVDSQNLSEWPMFASDRTILRDNEDRATNGVMRVTPNWRDLVMNHHKWIPCDSWDMIGGCDQSGMCPMGGTMKPGCKTMDKEVAVEVKEAPPAGSKHHGRMHDKG